jgi:imidazolonepropionase-like amidohydrolase
MKAEMLTIRSDLVLPDRIEADTALMIEGERIRSIYPAESAAKLAGPSGAAEVDARGRYVGPGYVDLHGGRR